MFEFLLKYSPVVYREGELVLQALPSLVALVLAVAVIFAILFWSYRRTTAPISAAWRSALITLRFLAFTLLLLALVQPAIRIYTVIPQKGSVIVLVDESQSMLIEDLEAGTRADQVRRILGDQQDGLLASLAENFRLQPYRFSSFVRPLESTEELTFSGKKTDLAGALAYAAEQAAGGVSAVVLLTDGVHTGSRDPLETAASLASRGIPLFAVGVGSKIDRDLALTKVSSARSVTENAVVEVSALLTQRGFEGETVTLELLDGSRVLQKKAVTLQGRATRATLQFSPKRKGYGKYTLRVSAGHNEIIDANNSQSFLVDNRSRRARVLYIEGYPRPEFKFLRRAFDGDPSIQIVSLLRTGPNKFYRQGVRDESELRNGFPTERAELFAYQALVLGNVPARFFTEEQLELIARFVSERGGGFLMLGGDSTFALGGYQETPIADLLPVSLRPEGTNGHSNGSNGDGDDKNLAFGDKFRLQLTPEGFAHPIMRLSSDDLENQQKWESLPELEGFNLLGGPKPGATVLATHPLHRSDSPKIIVANQRYGRGRTMVFASPSSWRWQMLMPHQDMSHERFWRQALRWLALSAPDRVIATVAKETFSLEEEVTVQVDVRDSTYTPLPDAEVTAQATKPDGSVFEVPLRWSTRGSGTFQADLKPVDPGMYLVRVEARSADGELLGTSETAFYAEEAKDEFTRPDLQDGLLRRLAEITGGRYYAADEASRLPEEISVMQSSYSKIVVNDLWDAPVIFLLVVLLLSVEWFVRRGKGLS
jgi:uncharacterized membrane protein